MTTAPKAKTAKVTVTAPKIATAWKSLTATTAKNDSENVTAINRLVAEMKLSALSIRDIQAVIKDTGKESSLVKVSHVEGLQTWHDLREKFADFRALDLRVQLSKATSAYKLGAGNAVQMPTWEAVEKAVKAHNKAKNDAKGNAPKADKAPKAKATNADTLRQILTFIQSLDFEAVSETDADILTEIYTVIEAKTLQLV